MSDDIRQPRKERVPRQMMAEQEPEIRRRNFREVPFGYSEEQALLEAARCIQCKTPLCVQGCPVNIDIPGFIKHIAEGDLRAAIRKMKEANLLPAVCGRVCPQETQCEERCILGKKYEPVAIGRLERYIADWERSTGRIEVPAVGRAVGQARRCDRQWPGGADGSRGLRAHGTRSRSLRSLAQARRRAGLRHPRVPPAQSDRRRGSAHTGAHGRQDPLSTTSSASWKRSTNCWTASTPCSSVPAPGCPGSWACRART